MHHKLPGQVLSELLNASCVSLPHESMLFTLCTASAAHFTLQEVIGRVHCLAWEGNQTRLSNSKVRCVCCVFSVNACLPCTFSFHLEGMTHAQIYKCTSLIVLLAVPIHTVYTITASRCVAACSQRTVTCRATTRSTAKKADATCLVLTRWRAGACLCHCILLS